VLHHELDRVVARERSVLDAVDAGADAGADAGIAVRVRGDTQTGAVGLVDDRRELLVGVLLRAGGPAVRHDAAGRGDLDDLRAVLDLVPHTLADLRHTVGDAFLDAQREHVGRHALEHRRVEVPAGRCDGVRGGDDAWPDHPAGVDRPLQRDVEEVATGLHHETEVPHGGEAGEQGRARVDRGAQRAEDRVVLDAVHGPAHGGRGVRAAEDEVDLHVHQAREQRHVAELDLLGR
jgi:hypothetical protein